MRRLVQPFVLLILACVGAPLLVVAGALLGSAGVSTLLLVFGSYAVVVLWLRRRRPDLTLPAGGEVAHCTVPDLCRAWSVSTRLLAAATAGELALRLVGLRQAYLDELECRDPDGFLRWVRTASDGRADPAPYFVPR